MATKSQFARETAGLCRTRVASIVSRGLDPLPPCVFALDVLLNAPVVDLTKVTSALSSDPGFSRRVLRLSDEILSASDESADSTEDALIQLGPYLFHAVVLLCAVTEIGEEASRDENAAAIWLHSVEMAILSEQIAEQSAYPSRGTACVAGLLHDIGYLPLLVAAREQGYLGGELGAAEWRDDVALEREMFGVDHCQVGAWMAKSWKFSPSLIDAVSHHHDPSKAGVDSHLAEIVFAAEHHGPALSRRETAEGSRVTRNPLADILPCGKLAEA